MKLYELPRQPEGVKLYPSKGMMLNVEGKYRDDVWIKFHHIDGMYSFCSVIEDGTLEDIGTIHLSASTPIEPYEDGYRIVSEKGE